MVEGRRGVFFRSVDAGGALFRASLRFSFEPAEDVGGGGRVFDGRVDGGAFSGWELVELLHFGVVAEAVGPPAGDEVHAVAFHFFEQFPAAVSCAGEFGSLFGLVLGFGGLILGGRCDGGYGAEEGAAVQNHGFVRTRQFGGGRRGMLVIWGRLPCDLGVRFLGV